MLFPSLLILGLFGSPGPDVGMVAPVPPGPGGAFVTSPNGGLFPFAFCSPGGPLLFGTAALLLLLFPAPTFLGSMLGLVRGRKDDVL